MAPKSARQKGGNARPTKPGEEKREDPLQALVLADSFETKFEPFTLETPRCLLPLANVPLIEYTLEFLAASNVEEVFLYCGNHTTQVEEYIATSKWSGPTSPFILEVIRSQSRSVGDAMRDMDQKQMLVGDFILVYGDVVANIDIAPALAEHKARREKDKKAIMTMLLREAGVNSRAKANSNRPVFVLDPSTQRCLHYEQLGRGQRSRLNLDGEILSDHADVDIRADLIDCGIDICSQEVLSQYSDNFDWQLPRRGFLHGILKDFELFQLTVHTHVATEGYAARVRSLQAYDAISRDVISRWTYPLCPDSNILPHQTYSLTNGNVYREQDVELARNVKAVKRSVLGEGTTIGEGSIVENCVIGRQCVIGKNVTLHGAYLLDGVKVGDGSRADHAIIAAGASIGAQCLLQPGSLVGKAVHISEGTIIQRHSRISRFRRQRTADGQPVPAETSIKVVGPTGQGALLEPDEDEDEPLESLAADDVVDDDDDAASISTLNSSPELDSEDDISVASHSRRSTRADSFGSVGSEESGDARRSAADFHHEAASSIFDSLQRGDAADSIQLELKALTLSSNADGKQVRRAVAVALMKRIANLVESGLTPQKAVAQTIPMNKLLVERAVLDRDAKVKTEQIEFLLFIQTDLLHRPQGSKILLFACNALAQGEMVDDEGLDQWLEDPRSSATEELREIKRETEEIIGGEEESSDEDDDDDE